MPVSLLLLAALSSLARAYLVNSTEYSSGALGRAPVQTFKSVNFTAAEWNFNVFPSSDLPSGYIFLAPRGTDVTTPTGIIYDSNGEVVWHGKEAGVGQTMSFSVGTYQREQVIATWGGSFNSNGYGDGHGLIFDQTYSLIANLSTTINGSGIDFHEFAISDNDTALATVYVTEEYDLSSYSVNTTDGTTGWIMGGAFQEIDIATGEPVFTWKSLDHVSPSECYTTPGTTGVSSDSPWDYFHINSIEKDVSGNYLISSRHCHAIYQISPEDGSILWTINGQNSSFTMGTNTTFEWQHDARWRNNYTQISVFDNAATSWESDEDMARGLLLEVDQSGMTVELVQEFLPWNETVSSSQGSIQEQGNGNYLLGWGQNPFFSEYSSDGTLLSSIQFGVGNVQGYRALRYNWTAYPTTSPDIAIESSDNSSSAYAVYTSWNGATEVSQWALYGITSLSNATSPTKLDEQDKTTFESSFNVTEDVASSYPWVQTQAISSNGTVLGSSVYVALSNGTESTVGNTTTSVGSPNTTAATSSAASATSSSAGASSSGAERVEVGLGIAGLAMLAVTVIL
ncbi:hypothetical protein I350_03532 [Cryptococcus amylolentus CBS 6273]|nr:hypothetical protein I350_03532 [Cryptococcus amylolentus CBS 6273]